VTGATGFIGGHLIRQLRADGISVIAVVRAIPPAELRVPGVEYVVLDLEHVDTLRGVLQEGDVIVHAAARAHIMRDTDPDRDATYRRSNVEPARMICRSAVESGARRIVFMSSAKVFGEGRERPYQRTETPAPADAYARSKLEAEQAVRDTADAGGIEWTIVRPPFVYGPGGKGNFPRLVALSRFATTVPLPLASISNCRSIVFVGNLVDAIVRCGLHEDAAGQILLPTDARDVSTPDLLRSMAKVRSSRALLFPCPVVLLRSAAAILRRSAEMARLTESLRLDSHHLKEQWAWQPPFSLERALERSMNAQSPITNPSLDA
jgi:nucleoside-diphosphate-sugar epimerase